ncbi:MAG TPA: flagellar basal body rod C-terminal domain-containing protein, partial [Acidobacteriaceae bacterium]
LTTAVGDAVVGDHGVIALPAGGAITISADGTVSSNGAVAARLKLVEFAPGSDPQSQGNNNYTAPASSVLPATRTQVRQGMLEGSNVNPVTGVIELIEAQRSAENMRHVLTMFDSEMNKTAVQDLARV